MSKELFSSASDLQNLKTNAVNLYNNALQWQSVGQDFQNDTLALLANYDPKGAAFQILTLSPFSASLPLFVSGNGFILKINAETNITMTLGNYTFIIQNGTWYSSFSNSIFFDDAARNSYLMFVNPQQGQYFITMDYVQSAFLTKFTQINGNYSMEEIAAVNGSNLVLSVLGDSIHLAEYQPGHFPTPTSNPNPLFEPNYAPVIIAAVVIIGMSIAILVWKKRPKIETGTIHRKSP